MMRASSWTWSRRGFGIISAKQKDSVFGFDNIPGINSMIGKPYCLEREQLGRSILQTIYEVDLLQQQLQKAHDCRDDDVIRLNEMLVDARERQRNARRAYSKHTEEHRCET